MSAPVIGVVGLWHLGTVIAAAWARLGHSVVGYDPDGARIAGLRAGRAPLYEPGLDDALRAGLDAGRLTFADEPAALARADIVFLAADTPVRDDDTSDVSALDALLARASPHLREGAILVVSSQTPAGTCARWESELRARGARVRVACSPENLRLGDAIEGYLSPGHVVLGARDETTLRELTALFAPMKAEIHALDLTGAELVKHGINAFLAMSITYANQLADLCERAGTDFQKVAAGLKADPRIGKRAYLAAGLGFSGGTLGRDLRALDATNQASGGVAPLFGELWRYNAARPAMVPARLERALGGLAGRRIGVLGLTYKPGTSTLRRSRAVEVARDLLARGAVVHAFDPKADWSEAPLPEGLRRAADAREAVRGADALVVLTAWPEFRELPLEELLATMRTPVVFDLAGVWTGRERAFAAASTYIRVGAAAPVNPREN